MRVSSLFFAAALLLAHGSDAALTRAHMRGKTKREDPEVLQNEGGNDAGLLADPAGGDAPQDLAVPQPDEPVETRLAVEPQADQSNLEPMGGPESEPGLPAQDPAPQDPAPQDEPVSQEPVGDSAPPAGDLAPPAGDSAPPAGDSAPPAPEGEHAVQDEFKAPEESHNGFHYLGCYVDQFPRDLSLASSEVSMAADPVTECAKDCEVYGAKFFALQSGYECYCGSEAPKYERVDDRECDHRCWGNSEFACGGVMKNSVYEVPEGYSSQQYHFGGWSGPDSANSQPASQDAVPVPFDNGNGYDAPPVDLHYYRPAPHNTYDVRERLSSSVEQLSASVEQQALTDMQMAQTVGALKEQLLVLGSTLSGPQVHVHHPLDNWGGDVHFPSQVFQPEVMPGLEPQSTWNQPPANEPETPSADYAA